MSEEYQSEIFSAEELSECELLPRVVIERLKGEENAIAKYTAERLQKLHPKTYNAIKALLAKNVSVNEVAHLVGCHSYTVESIRELEANYIANAKKRLSKNVFAAAELAIEKIKDGVLNVDATKIDDFYKLGLLANTLIEKGQLLSGGATERVEQVDAKNFQNKDEYETAMFGEIIDCDQD